ncbi:hypothetical protein BGX27_008194 [Mortierella sp. AM989]|nr:hypothetical protein BGX27_008194 [Mortierella sp. AM989]
MTTADTTQDAERRPLLKKTRPSYTDGSVEQPISEEHSVDHDQSRDLLDETARLEALKALPWYRRPSVTWLLPFVFLLAIVMGISQAPQDQLIIKIVCKEYLKDKNTSSLLQDTTSLAALNRTSLHDSYYDDSDDTCNTPAILAFAALTMSRIRSLKYVSAIFTIGYYTSMSDRHGRKALIFLTLAPVMFTQILIVYMAHPTINLGMWILYVDALFVGLLGAGLLLEPCLNSYIADCTPREGRSLIMGYVMVALSLGLIAGPILGVFLIKITGNITSTMTISIIIQGILIFYAIILPESLPKHLQAERILAHNLATRSPMAEKTPLLIKIKNGIVAVLDPLLLFLPGRIEASADINILPSKYTLVILIVAYGLNQFAVVGIISILIPYTNLVFKWNALEDDIYFISQGAATFIVYVGIFPSLQMLYRKYIEKQSPEAGEISAGIPLSPSEVDASDFESGSIEEAARSSQLTNTETRKKTTWNDLSFFIFGCIVYLISHLLISFIKTEAMFFISGGARALASVSLPAFYSLITSYIPTHQTGKALGGICILDTIIMSISSLLYGWIFSATSSTIPSAVFLVSSAFTVVSVSASLTIWRDYKRVEGKK